MKELSEEQYRQISAYLLAGTHTLPGRHGFRIPAVVLDQWLQNGYAVLRTNTLARTYGVHRKTICKAIKSAISHGFVKRVGVTDDGRAKYVPCLERGAQWRAECGVGQ